MSEELKGPKGTAGYVALELVKTHIAECTDARKETRDAIVRIHQRMDGQGRMAIATLLSAVGGLLVALAAVVWYVIAQS